VGVGRSRRATLTTATQKAAQAYGRALSRVFKEHAELFQAWGSEGGKTRARKLTAEQRRAIARKAAQARWAAKPPGRKHGARPQ
jgi:hypothetical protein